MSTSINSNEANHILLEIVGRKFFNLISRAGDASLISRWYNICDESFNTEELQRLIEQGREVFEAAPEAENNDVPMGEQSSSHLSVHDETPSSVSKIAADSAPGLSSWKTKEVMQPIEVIVDESTGDMELDNQPSTSSSVISSHADTQQDAKVYTRIGELRSAGLWSVTRLPICVEPPRPKLHWDFLLEEVLWMSADFRQERRIKRRLARKLCSEAKQQWRKKFDSKKNEKFVQEKEAKRVCSSVARMVKEFWMNVDKVVDFRTKEILDSQKRKALDQHLTFLVGEADKLSTLLHERLGNDSEEPSSSLLINNSSVKKIHNFDTSLPASSKRTNLPKFAKKSSSATFLCNKDDEDDEENEFEVDSSDEEEDDERTLDMEEKRANKAVVDEELNDLSHLADLDDDDFFKTLPPGYLERFYRGRRFNEVDEVLKDGVHANESSDNALMEKSGASGGNEGDDEADDAMEVSMASLDGVKDSSTLAKNTRVEDDEEGEGVLKEALDVEMDAVEEPMDLKKVDYSNLKSDNQEIRRRELNNIAEVASEFQPKGNTLETTQVKTEVPFLIRGNLREYQLVGLDWLVTLYERNLNGILADEMGLGKTIQTVALLAHLACEKMIWGPHLIIVPTSVILNWEMEFKKWCPSLKILTYFGSAKERAEKRKGWTKNNVFHVCITSYKIASQDIKALKSKAWQYIILDEAQNIKNFKSQRWQTLLNIRSRRRLLLTGTPLQNSLMELWSLLHFLMPAVFASHEDFKDWFSNPMNSMVEGNIDVDKALVQRLHKVLRPFILRRLKSEVERQLPTKQEKVIACPLSKRQRFLYNEFLSRKDTRHNLQSGNMMSVLNVIMQLRKCCNHPNLFEPRPVISPFVAMPLRLTISRHFIFNSLRDVGRDEAKFCDEADERSSALTLSIRAVGSLNYWKCFARISTSEAIRKSVEEPPLFSERLPKLNGLKFCVDNTPGRSATFYKCSVDKEASTSSVLFNGGEKTNIKVNDTTKTSGPLKNGRKRPAVLIFDEGIECEDTTRKRSAKSLPAKRSCRFGNICAEYRQRREAENRRVGMWLREIYHLAGAPALAEETIHVMRHFFDDYIIDRDGFGWKEGNDEENPDVTVFSLTKFSPSFASRPRCYWANSLLKTSQSSSLFPSKNSSAFVCGMEQCDGLFKHACDLISLGISDWLHSSIKNFMLHVSKVFCEAPQFNINLKSYDKYNELLCKQVSQRIYSKEDDKAELIRMSHVLQFPELRLIEYDCGKLQTLSKLLKQLYENKHRCLIFTQMSRMLDILQAFLSYYSYKYFRLDGSTHIDQRQAMMERFNNDTSVFCFILSTRSGGVGVNLTGADTVIFYDSDWNPTMDAQAQDRCHRIGQTRNVTIYRLISEKTIEENILKKANQKRRLGEMTLDEAEFTPQFFRSADNIRDLFSNEESVAEIVAPFASGAKEIEQAMANAEDQQDVLAARKAQAEASIDVAEFDEGINIQSQQQIPRTSSRMSQTSGAKSAAISCTNEKTSKYLNDIENASEQYIELISSMTPVERYAIAFLENEYRPELEEEVKEAAALIEAKKEDYLKKSSGETGEEMDVDENDETVGRRGSIELMEHDTYDDDLLKEVFSANFSIDAIPLWMPPSPPNSETGETSTEVIGLTNLRTDSTYYDFMLDDYACALYESCLIPESRLPPLPPAPPPLLSAAATAAVGSVLRHGHISHHRRNHHDYRDGTEIRFYRDDKSPSVDGTQKETTGKASSNKHFRRHLAAGGQPLQKKSRHRIHDGEGGTRKVGDALRRNETLVYASQSPSPSPRTGTPSVGNDANSKAFDEDMISALNSAAAAVAAAAASARADGPQKIDESIERVRRNSTQRTTTQQAQSQQTQKQQQQAVSLPATYVTTSGSLENVRDVLYYPSSTAVGGSTVPVSPFSRQISASGEIVAPHGGFVLPAPRVGETDDCDEGARWFIEEDCRLLAAVLVHTKLTPTLLGDCPSCLELNWDYVSHYVNMRSTQYRSPRRCCHRYQALYLKTAHIMTDSEESRLMEREISQKMMELQAVYGQYHPNSVAATAATYYNNGRFMNTTQQQKMTPRYVLYVDEAQRERQNTADFQRRARSLNDAAALRRATYGPLDVLAARVASQAMMGSSSAGSATKRAATVDQLPPSLMELKSVASVADK